MDGGSTVSRGVDATGGAAGEGGVEHGAGAAGLLRDAAERAIRLLDEL